MAQPSLLSKDYLSQLNRKDLQNIAKQHGVKANLKSSEIIEQLLNATATTASNPAPSMAITPVKLVQNKENLPQPLEKSLDMAISGSQNQENLSPSTTKVTRADSKEDIVSSLALSFSDCNLEEESGSVVVYLIHHFLKIQI